MMTSPQDYARLTPDFMLDAIESLNIYPASGLLALNSYENRVYQFSCDEGARYVVKFYRPGRWSSAQIIEEHDFSLELAHQEIPVIAPCVINKQTLHNFQGFYFSLFPCQGGRTFEVDNLDHLEWVGRFMGKIHKVGQSNAFQHRIALNTQNFLIQPQQFLLSYSAIPASLRDAFNTALNTLTELTLEKCQDIDSVSTLRLLGDCHAGNILWTDQGPHFVDLDDSVTGPAIQDLWMMLSGSPQNQAMQLDVLLEGYNEFCDFNIAEIQLIAPLRSMRMISYMHWLAKRWDDPAFPVNFPWFNTVQYWEQQIVVLREQITALTQPTLKLPGHF